MPRLPLQRKSWRKLRILLLQPIQPTLLSPMLQRISLLSSLLAIVLGIQRTLQPMFVQPKRRMCHHTTMGTSHYLRMPRQMPSSWTTLQWKHPRRTQSTPIRRLLPRTNCRMHRLPQRITIQRALERLFVWRKIQNRTCCPSQTLNFIHLTKNENLFSLLSMNWLFHLSKFSFRFCLLLLSKLSSLLLF